MTDASIAAVREAANRAIASIQEMQGALGLARDRGQTAVDIAKIAARDTTHDQPMAALAHMANADRLCEEAVGSTLAAVECLQNWTSIL